MSITLPGFIAARVWNHTAFLDPEKSIGEVNDCENSSYQVEGYMSSKLTCVLSTIFSFDNNTDSYQLTTRIRNRILQAIDHS